jgi:hypothetical protein
MLLLLRRQNRKVIFVSEFRVAADMRLVVHDLCEDRGPTVDLYEYGNRSHCFAAVSSGPAAPSMFDDDDAEVLEEEDAAGSDDDAFVVAKPQVSHFAPCVKNKTSLKKYALQNTLAGFDLQFAAEF